MNYNETVHMRLSAEQKKAILGVSDTYDVNMSTAIRWMLDYCINDPDIVREAVTQRIDGEYKDGVI